LTGAPHQGLVSPHHSKFQPEATKPAHTTSSLPTSRANRATAKANSWSSGRRNTMVPGKSLWIRRIPIH